MKWCETLFLSAVAVAAVACDDGGHGDDPAFDHFAAELDESAAALERHMAAHHAEAAAAGDLPAMHRVEAAHRDRARDLMDAMDGARRNLGMCARAMMMMGAMHDMAPMDAAARDVAAELARHDAAMRNAPDLPAARAEEVRHRDAMDDALARLRGHRDEMGRSAAGMRCRGMGSHMHRRGEDEPP